MAEIKLENDKDSIEELLSTLDLILGSVVSGFDSVYIKDDDGNEIEIPATSCMSRLTLLEALVKIRMIHLEGLSDCEV